jgi:hypothetical protein
VVDHLVRWLRSAGVLEAADGPPALRLALSNLNHRLRYAAGEYDHPPPPRAGQVDQYLGFASEPAARAFAEAVRTQGEPVADPVEVDGRAYDGEVRWQVAVRTTELPLSAEFDAQVRRLRSLAADHGGTYGGWGEG